MLAIKFKTDNGYAEFVRPDEGPGLCIITPQKIHYFTPDDVASLVRCLRVATDVLAAARFTDGRISIDVDRADFGKSIVIRREYDGVFIDIKAPYTQVLSTIRAVMEDK